MLKLYKARLKAIDVCYVIDENTYPEDGAAEAIGHEMENVSFYLQNGSLSIKEIKKLTDIPESWTKSGPWGEVAQDLKNLNTVQVFNLCREMAKNTKAKPLPPTRIKVDGFDYVLDV